MRAFRDLGRKELDIDMFSDLTFLLGDFNFRLDTSYSIIIDNIENIWDFFNLDQLCKEKHRDVDFVDFNVRLACASLCRKARSHLDLPTSVTRRAMGT